MDDTDGLGALPADLEASEAGRKLRQLLSKKQAAPRASLQVSGEGGLLPPSHNSTGTFTPRRPVLTTDSKAGKPIQAPLPAQGKLSVGWAQLTKIQASRNAAQALLNKGQPASQSIYDNTEGENCAPRGTIPAKHAGSRWAQLKQLQANKVDGSAGGAAPLLHDLLNGAPQAAALLQKLQAAPRSSTSAQGLSPLPPQNSHELGLDGQSVAQTPKGQKWKRAATAIAASHPQQQPAGGSPLSSRESSRESEHYGVGIEGQPPKTKAWVRATTAIAASHILQGNRAPGATPASSASVGPSRAACMPPTTVPAGKPVATVPLVWNPVAMMPDDDLADDAPYAADEYGAQDEADAYWLEMPGCWDEVDPGELEAFASHLSAVSEGPSSTAEATPVIPHAPDPSTDAEDLLGQGFIDTRQCTLRRSEGRQRRASVFMAGTHRLGLGVGGITRVPAGPPPPHPGASLRRNEMAAAPHVGLAPALKRHGSVMMGGGSFTSALDRVNQIVGSSLGGSAADSVQRSASSASEAMGRLHTTGRLASVLRMSRPKAVTSMTHQMHKIRKQVMPTSEDFSPSAYLLRMHLNTPLTKLQQGQTRVTANIAEHQEQVKRLVKENFRSVIKTHLSIADIHKYLLKTEMANSEFRCTQGVITSIADVQQAASATYATIVQRQSLVDKSRTAISMFKRQEALLAIPFRIQEFTRLRAYDDVIREYTKAWGLIQGSDTQQRQVKPGSFFDGIMQEIDAAVRDALEQAVESLQDPRLTALEAREPAQLILHLQAQNVPCSLRVNPLLLFIGSKARHFDSRLSRLCSQHGLPPHDFVARALARNRPKKHSVSFKDSEMDDLFNAGTFSSSTLYASSVASTSAMSHDAASTTTAGMSSYHSSEAGSATAGSTLAPSTTMTPSTSQALLAELSDTGTDISEVPSDHSGVTATSVGSEAESAGAKTLAPQTAPPVVTVKTWCRLVGKVTRLLGKHVVAMGQIPTSLGPHLLARPWLSSQAQGDLQHAAADSHVAIAAMTAACKHLLQDILGKLNGAGIAEGDAQAGMAGALEVVLAAADELAAGGGPAPALDAMHDVVETAVSYLVSHICSRMGSQLGQAAQEERWERECSAEVQAEYGSISLMPGRLEGAITEAFSSLQVLASSHGKQAAPLVSRHAEALRGACFDAFRSFVTATDSLAASAMLVTAAEALGNKVIAMWAARHVVEVADETEEEREIKLAAKVLRRWLPSHMPSLAALEATEGEVAVAPQWKLLVLLSNCAFVRQKLLPDLSAHFQGLLTADGMPEDDWMNLVRTCGDDVMLVEERLSQSYINSKGAIFEKAVQSYLYEDALWWTREQIPTAIRDEALELMYTLTIVQAEVAYNAPPGMLLQILKVLIKNLLLSWNSEVETVVGGASLGGLVQLSLELHFMKAALVQFVRPPADRVFTSAQAMVAGQVMRVVGAGGPHAARVQEVLGAVRRATSVTAWLDSASERLVAPALQAARLNLNFFMQARTGATSRATPLSKLDNAKRLIKVQGGAEETAAGIPRRLTAKFRMGSAGSITGRRKSLLIAGGLSGLPFNTSFASSSHFSSFVLPSSPRSPQALDSLPASLGKRFSALPSFSPNSPMSFVQPQSFSTGPAIPSPYTSKAAAGSFMPQHSTPLGPAIPSPYTSRAAAAGSPAAPGLLHSAMAAGESGALGKPKWVPANGPHLASAHPGLQAQAVAGCGGGASRSRFAASAHDTTPAGLAPVPAMPSSDSQPSPYSQGTPIGTTLAAVAAAAQEQLAVPKDAAVIKPNSPLAQPQSRATNDVAIGSSPAVADPLVLPGFAGLASLPKSPAPIKTVAGAQSLAASRSHAAPTSPESPTTPDTPDASYSPHSIGAVSQSEAAALWAQRIPQQHAGFSSRGR